jgi:large subunit ribosomal protein L22
MENKKIIPTIPGEFVPLKAVQTIDERKKRHSRRLFLRALKRDRKYDFFSATSKYLRIAPSKIDAIISKIRGKSYPEALIILKYLPQKAGAIVWQTLYSAISNATNNSDKLKENLIILEAFVNQGPILKRMRPRAQGRAFAIQKKMSHLTIRVCDLEEIEHQNQNHQKYKYQYN